MTVAINQHKVPQMLLKHFTVGKKGHIWAYDKKTGRRFHTLPRNVAAERRFYDLPVGGEFVSFEPLLGSLETAVAPLIKRIVRSQSIGWLSAEERKLLGFFAAVQFCRTDHMRESFKQMNEQLVERLKEWDVSEVGGESVGFANKQSVKAFALEMMRDAGKFAPHFLHKDWVLQRAPGKHHFYIGDNPVTLQNLSETQGWNRGIGLASKGTELYLPVSSKLTLAMYCPSHLGSIKSEHERLKTKFELLNMRPKAMAATESMLRAVCQGEAIEIESDSVENANYLQVRFASRYVYSAVEDFELVESMIGEDSEYRGGVKPWVG